MSKVITTGVCVNLLILFFRLTCRMRNPRKVAPISISENTPTGKLSSKKSLLKWLIKKQYIRIIYKPVSALDMQTITTARPAINPVRPRPNLVCSAIKYPIKQAMNPISRNPNQLFSFWSRKTFWKNFETRSFVFPLLYVKLLFAIRYFKKIRSLYISPAK